MEGRGTYMRNMRSVKSSFRQTGAADGTARKGVKPFRRTEALLRLIRLCLSNLRQVFVQGFWYRTSSRPHGIRTALRLDGRAVGPCSLSCSISLELKCQERSLLTPLRLLLCRRSASLGRANMGSRMKDVQRKLDLSLEDLVEEQKTNGGGKGGGRKRRRPSPEPRREPEPRPERREASAPRSSREPEASEAKEPVRRRDWVEAPELWDELKQQQPKITITITTTIIIIIVIIISVISSIVISSITSITFSTSIIGIIIIIIIIFIIIFIIIILIIIITVIITAPRKEAEAPEVAGARKTGRPPQPAAAPGPMPYPVMPGWPAYDPRHPHPAWRPMAPHMYPARHPAPVFRPPAYGAPPHMPVGYPPAMHRWRPFR
eukprot:s1715_g7.t1